VNWCGEFLRMVIIGETYTECTNEYGETKWNIACRGRMVWVDKVAVIVTDKD